MINYFFNTLITFYYIFIIDQFFEKIIKFYYLLVMDYKIL